MKILILLLISQVALAKLENKINYIADILIREQYLINDSKERADFVKRQLIEKSAKSIDNKKLEKIIDENTKFLDLKEQITKRLKENYSEEEINKLMAILETKEMRKLAKDVIAPILVTPLYTMDKEKIIYELKELRKSSNK
ncbi:hypothetical protein DAY19_06145 [Halobacteriovorax vibrionivorans]|uniref:Uncharacterized protein n=1 Tax=Halobacteriovorax vibrionivorans TaxID=2152716 RepID=A0ABY0IE73_9BACT|nr:MULTISPECIES: hypothetical protein [Halobacteriovorax]RZF21261.1 hypothetical protein DAY19_06145 [Halobacteriovorax vibrionivorans]TGD47981.1 hypothetical protein EP118_05985 [Halobacteriovorax sp. Y22]